nr:MAG TPA: INTRON TRANSFERASE [Crassvirales sp.]
MILIMLSINRWKERKKKYIKLLGGQCDCCHIKFNDTNYAIFDFHHINPNTKEYTWDKLRLFSDFKIRAELSKCQLLCVNCHRLIHSTS